MSQRLTKSLTKCLVDTLIAIEFSDESTINEDASVGILEQISANLQDLTEDDKITIINEITELSQQYPKEVCEFVKSIPEHFGISG